MSFTFLQRVEPHPPGDALFRFKMQTLSDMYSAMQARLDSYRQSAGAVFLSIAAAALTVDSAFFRFFFDRSTLAALSPWVIGIAGLVIFVVCMSGFLILRYLDHYFAEMTSIIYKIDEANEVWITGAWLPGMKLYPNSFKKWQPVGRSPEDRAENLRGWPDFAITLFQNILFWLAIIHFLCYGILIMAVLLNGLERYPACLD